MNQQDQATIRAALAILDAHLKQPGAALTSPEAVMQHLRLTLEGEEREVFVVLFLNTQHGLIASEMLSVGTIDQAAVYPREVARRALLLNAAAVILAHNHPSGSVTPSVADEQITKHLRNALGLFDIRVLDHIIVGAGRMASFVNLGLL